MHFECCNYGHIDSEHWAVPKLVILLVLHINTALIIAVRQNDTKCYKQSTCSDYSWITLYRLLAHSWANLLNSASQCWLYVESSWNVTVHGVAQEGYCANAVGSQCSSHYLGTWCIQHYYRWCARLCCQYSTELTPLGRFKWTRPFRWKTNSGFCACAITFKTQSTSVSYCVKVV